MGSRPVGGNACPVKNIAALLSQMQFQSNFRCSALLIFVAYSMQFRQEVQRTEIEQLFVFNIPVRCTLPRILAFVLQIFCGSAAFR